MLITVQLLFNNEDYLSVFFLSLGSFYIINGETSESNTLLSIVLKLFLAGNTMSIRGNIEQFLTSPRSEGNFVSVITGPYKHYGAKMVT